ncbi:hypothetical protein KP509_32G017700 [Ceratopteris richardii]|uniref:Transcription factor CBF/NF-Y/archaeal histone domain-containing protein n=1 Tax=Ceratopteris richardii TaxID=49495 RepID=A0A8T2QRU4_CERRI|nr:hypothetical protein KP509_32G017700 [Ceratopteris richardii]KAH7286678.1 hypothetical protein KP509_32G017700 [Ceratopteris richardii]
MADHIPRQNSPDSGHQSDEESGGHYGGGHDSVREQDRLLPIANVSRIMKKALPANAKISKDAKETVQECVSEFISFITGEASDKCQREKRKTVNGDDLLWAMGTLGFEDYLEPLKVYLHKYREIEGERATMAKQGEQMTKDAGVIGGPSGAVMGVNGVINGGAIPGTVQMMQPQAGYVFPQHQYVQTPYQMQPMHGGNSAAMGRPAGGNGQVRGT